MDYRRCWDQEGTDLEGGDGSSVGGFRGEVGVSVGVRGSWGVGVGGGGGCKWRPIQDIDTDGSNY